MDQNNDAGNSGLDPKKPPHPYTKHPKKPVDGRLKSARRLRGLYMSFMSATNQKHPELCKFAAGLAYQLETLNDQIANGKTVNLNDYTRAGNSLHRALATLGIESWLTESNEDQSKKPSAEETLTRLRDPKTWQPPETN